MKGILISLLMAFVICNVNAQRQTLNISEGWKFKLTSDSSARLSDFDDDSWTTIDLPHTWNNLDGQDGGNNYYRGKGWYRKLIFADASWSEDKIFLRFGSANEKADVYVNGQLVGTHYGGYAAFVYDISGYLNFNENNIIAVSVDNSSSIDIAPLSADFTFCGGLTREVKLLITDKIFISPLDYASPGVYLTPYAISGSLAKVNAKILIGNEYTTAKTVQVQTIIKDKNNQTVDSVASDLNMDANSSTEAMQELQIDNPQIWNGRHDAYLYHTVVKLLVDGTVKDELQQSLGIRSFSVSSDSGFYLNGEKYRLYGVALHEDKRDKGRAISDSDRKEGLDMLNELGCTFIRLSHYQHGQYTYNYCDSTGIVLWTEVPAINNVSSSSLFQNNIKNQLRELIKQNYNHPSVCFWGLCNEVNYQAGPDPAPLITQLNNLAHSLDSTRLTTAAAMFDDRATNWIPDLISCNRYFGWYYGTYNDFAPWADQMHASHPATKIGVSEYGVGANPADHQENAFMPVNYGPFHPEEYQNLYHETYWKTIEQRPYLWETSVWVAFDFSSDGRNEGKNPGVNDKGLITQDRKIKKDAYYYYKANWSDNPFVYISSRRFTERTDSVVEVKVYSNCDSVTLTVNDSIYNSLTAKDHIFKWVKALLKAGTNRIFVNGFKDNIIFSDSCFWNYSQTDNGKAWDTLVPSEIQINFQPRSFSTPAGYLVDDGSQYANRNNGYTYGWRTADLNTRARTTSSDPLFNTFDHMQLNNAFNIWEIAVGNGTYLVGVGCGDPDFFDSYHVLQVENKVILEGQHKAEGMIKRTDTVEVNDGKLTVMPGPGSINAKLNVVHIHCIECEALPNTIAQTSLNRGLSVFPNPVNDVLFVQTGLDNNEGFQYYVCDVLGRMIRLKGTKGGVPETVYMDVNFLKPGIYTLQITSGNQVIHSAKFLKE